jgi:hypothetical protein
MSSKSKNKGKSWERDVCLFLSDLYRESFIRVPGSGAFIGGSNQFRKDTLSEEQIKLSRGDIIPPLHYPYFLAECKNYADFPFHLLIGKNSIAQLDTWIDQVEHDVTSEKDFWILFIKITRKGTYVLFDTNLYDPKESCVECRKTYGTIYKNYWFAEMNQFFSVHKKNLEMMWRSKED